MTTPKIYVACLSSYNNSILHGRWIEASSDKEAMQEEINSMLRESPMQGKEIVEEWEIHDSEALPHMTSLTEIAAYMELIEDHPEFEPDDMAEIVEYFGLEEAKSALQDRFCGLYDSFRDYSDEAADEALACFSVPDDSPLARYFDYEAWSRDLRLELDVIELPGGGVAVFHH